MTGTTPAPPRAPRGTPTGGQFAATGRTETDVVLVEFAIDEAQQVEQALSAPTGPGALPAAGALARRGAREQVRAMRAHLNTTRPFAAAAFDSTQVQAMVEALEIHRSTLATTLTATRPALDAAEAALFRLDTATPAPAPTPGGPR